MAEQILKEILEETQSYLAINNSKIIKIVRKLQEREIITLEEATEILAKLPLMRNKSVE